MLFEFIILILLGIIFGIFMHKYFIYNNKKVLLEKAEEIFEMGKQETIKLKENAKKSARKYLEDITKECENILKGLQQRKEIYDIREKNITKKEDGLRRIEQSIRDRKSEVNKVKKEINNLREREVESLLNQSKISYEDASKEIYQNLDNLIQSDYQIRLKKKSEHIKESADQEGINIINSVVQRYSRKNASRVSFVPLQATSKFLKSKAKDIEILEKITEAELDFDEEEGLLYVNHYNIVRKTAAYNVIKKILQNKKKIFDVKELLKKESNHIHQDMEKLGTRIVRELKIDNLPKEVVKLIGRLNYRTSFGQNILSHSLEVAFFSTMLAYEIGADPKIAKISALLHDLGKAVDQDIEGPHDILTKKILEKYNVNEDIVHAAYNHHSAEEMKSVEARIVQAADAMSASRPGARIEAGEQYIKRIQALEETALAMEGVNKAYAIQAGREIRSFVDPDKISDKKMAEIAIKLAKNIEENVQYPGQVMVNVIREFKVTELAK